MSQRDFFVELYAQVERGAAQMELRTEAVRAIQQAQQRMLDGIAAQMPPVACQAGCHYCCQQRVDALPHEVALAYLEVKDEKLDAVRQHLRRHEGKTNVQRLQSWCPLLGTDGRCTIYSVRPGSCRGYHSFSVEACEKGPGAGRHPHCGELITAEVVIAAACQAVFRARNLEAELVDLARGLAHLQAQYGADREAPLVQWLAGRRLFPRELRRTPEQKKAPRGMDKLLVQIRTTLEE